MTIASTNPATGETLKTFPPDSDAVLEEKLRKAAAAAKQSAYRLRKRYRELFRGEVARTVADESEVDDELGRLLEILGD